jgi:uncharacterized protein (DUF169 family)
MEKNERLSQVISEYIRPILFPLAVKYTRGEPVPAKARRPIEFLGYPIPLCQGINIARRYGWTLAFKKEDHGCAPSLAYFGYVSMPAFMKRGGTAYKTYAKTEDGAQKCENALSVMEYDKLDTILIAPLQKAAFEPDVVLVYANPGQVVRMVQGSNYTEGGAIETQVCGRCACTSELIAPHRHQKCNVVIPGGGEKVFGMTGDDELVFCLPFSQADNFIEGILATHNSGVARMPFPIFGLRMKPQFPETYAELETEFGLRPPK